MFTLPKPRPDVNLSSALLYSPETWTSTAAATAASHFSRARGLHPPRSIPRWIAARPLPSATRCAPPRGQAAVRKASGPGSGWPGTRTSSARPGSPAKRTRRERKKKDQRMSETVRPGSGWLKTDNQHSSREPSDQNQDSRRGQRISGGPKGVWPWLRLSGKKWCQVLKGRHEKLFFVL